MFRIEFWRTLSLARCSVFTTARTLAFIAVVYAGAGCAQLSEKQAARPQQHTSPSPRIKDYTEHNAIPDEPQLQPQPVIPREPGPVIPFTEFFEVISDTGETTISTMTFDLQSFIPDAVLSQFMTQWIVEKENSFGIGWSLEVKPPVGLTFDDEHLIKSVNTLEDNELAGAGITESGIGGNYYVEFMYKGREYRKWIGGDEDRGYVILPEDTEELGDKHKSKYPIIVEVGVAYLRRERQFLREYGVIRRKDTGPIELTQEILESILLGHGGHLKMDNSDLKGWRLKLTYNDGTIVPIELGQKGREFEKAFFANRVGFIRYPGHDSVELTEEGLKNLLPVLDKASASRYYHSITPPISFRDARSTLKVPIIIKGERARLEFGRGGRRIMRAYFGDNGQRVYLSDTFDRVVGKVMSRLEAQRGTIRTQRDLDQAIKKTLERASLDEPERNVAEKIIFSMIERSPEYLENAIVYKELKLTLELEEKQRVEK